MASWFLSLLLSIAIICIQAHPETPLGDPLVEFDPTLHENVYTVGVLAIRGFEDAYSEFNATFTKYLTETAGRQFDPPISFRMQPLDFFSMFTSIDAKPPLVDFIYLNPSAYSCIESEYTAYSLVSQVSRRKVNDKVYDLEMFGGVITARADNDEVQTIHDLKDKIVAAASISGLGSGQMQFLEMIKEGMNYINDPKQLVFTSDQGKVVSGVLNGDFDVGFVRTDQIERTKDENGNPIDTSLLKIIHVNENANIDGTPFPFTASTDLYPEWNVAALSHVHADAQRIVQHALLSLADFAKDVDPDVANITAYNSTYITEVAREALSTGKYAAWQPTLSYMQLRTMQQATGFITLDEATKSWKCIKAPELYDAVVCPAGFYKINKGAFDTECKVQHGLECQEDFQCVCTPCHPIKVCEELEIGGNCVSYIVFLPSLLVPLFAIAAVCVHCYVEHKRKEADAVWIVKPSELLFDDPAIMIGRGSFGMVLLAEYRGTKVAVKRVIPPTQKGVTRFDRTHTTSSYSASENKHDIENPGLKSIAPNALNVRSRRVGSLGSFDMSFKATYSRLKSEFVCEMRQLAKLRHPCITTVMGAVISRSDEPMLVMEYMDYGSLYELLRNNLIEIDHDQTMSFMRDVSQGLRFLHSANPQVVHGDLKAKNVLIDANLRAKVADFGFSAKKKVGAVGTPYWMAPELLLRKSCQTPASDIYSFGILIFEMYARVDPYQGEDHDAVISGICDPGINKRPAIPARCPPKVAKLMEDCLSQNPSNRPSAEQLDLSIRVEASVKERTCKLEALNLELEEANRKIASASEQQLEHFACMSHELRTPLNCILGLASLLEDTDLQPTQKENVSMIVSSSKLLRFIVDDVLDYSKLQAGHAGLDVKPADLQQIVVDSLSSMTSSTLARNKNVTIVSSFDMRLHGNINTDSRRLQQILYNLLSNAVKFSKDGGEVEFQISIDASEGKEHPPKQNLRFIVVDHGKGIQQNQFENIFKPFTQAGTGINNPQGGTGLGLAITKKLVEALGGNIWVESEFGHWTKFFVDFPFDGTLVDVETFSSRLGEAKVMVVDYPDSKESDRILESMNYFKVDCRKYSNMGGLEATLKLESTATHVCFVHGDLYEKRTFDNISNKSNVLLIPFGSDVKIDEASFRFGSLVEVFPTTLLQRVIDCVEVQKASKCRGQVLRNDQKSDISDASAGLSALRILIAEDNLINQKVLKRILNRIGVKNIKVVEDGKQAVDLEAVEEFDIIYMDLQMPVMDGIEACKIITGRPDDKHPKPKVIFCTAHVSESFERTCLESGGVSYLSKPVTKDIVKDSLVQVVYGNESVS